VQIQAQAKAVVRVAEAVIMIYALSLVEVAFKTCHVINFKFPGFSEFPVAGATSLMTPLALHVIGSASQHSTIFITCKHAVWSLQGFAYSTKPSVCPVVSTPAKHNRQLPSTIPHHLS